MGTISSFSALLLASSSESSRAPLSPDRDCERDSRGGVTGRLSTLGVLPPSFSLALLLGRRMATAAAGRAAVRPERDCDWLPRLEPPSLSLCGIDESSLSLIL
jgi:hypothetical protein